MAMKGDCDWIRDRLAAFRSGWLDAGESQRVQTHLESCAACSKEAERDADLVLALGAAMADERVAPAWSPEARPMRRWVLSPVFALPGIAAVALAATLLWSRPSGEAPNAPPTSVEAAEPDLASAHVMAGVADGSSDPTRAIVLAAYRRKP